MKVLLVEDDAKLAGHLINNLKDHGMMLHHALNLRELEEQLLQPETFDVLVLDRLLGKTDSKDYLPRIRQRWPHVPIVMLSAICTPNERTHLINLGADDYVGKPFSTLELVARINAILRRTQGPIASFTMTGNLSIDLGRRVISVGATCESLPNKEFFVLKTLTEEPGKVWSRNDLLDHVWGINSDVSTNAVEATIANLRRRLEALGASISIRNARLAGYWIEV